MTASAADTNMTAHFDDSNVAWQALNGFEGMVLSLCSVEPESNCVDFLVKFAPDSKVLFHRHLAATHSFVIEGAHVIYEEDGSRRETRPVGTYSITPASDDVHSEGGGPDGCVLLYSARGTDAELFEMFDGDFKSAGKMTVGDFVGLSGG